jgi:hypothetical protein
LLITDCILGEQITTVRLRDICKSKKQGISIATRANIQLNITKLKTIVDVCFICDQYWIFTTAYHKVTSAPNNGSSKHNAMFSARSHCHWTNESICMFHGNLITLHAKCGTQISQAKIRIKRKKKQTKQEAHLSQQHIDWTASKIVNAYSSPRL